jgi:hypothetical protein
LASSSDMRQPEPRQAGANEGVQQGAEQNPPLSVWGKGQVLRLMDTNQIEAPDPTNAYL